MNKPKKYDLIKVASEFSWPKHTGVGIYFGFIMNEVLDYHLIYINNRFYDLQSLTTFYVLYHNEQTKKV